MTGLLTDLMHDRADRLEAPELDLATITREGDRVVRRRRAAVVGGVAACALVVAAAGSLLVGGGRDSDDVVAAGPVAQLDQLSWVSGRTLHTGSGATVELGADVRAWVWVGDAIVYTDPSRQVRLWQGGAEREIGTSVSEGDLPELVTDGTFVAWVGADHRVVRYDTSDGRTERSPATPGDRLRVTAIDGAVVYVADSAGVYAWRPTQPEAFETLGTDPRAVVLDAENGTRVRTAPGRTVVLERKSNTLEVAAREFADLSPDARLVSLEDDDKGVVIDADSGVEVPFDHDHEWSVGYQWIDATTLAVLAFDGIDDEATMTGTLLVCDATSGACAESDGLATSDIGDFQLPIGIHFSA